MPPTLGALLRTPKLRLRLLTGGDRLDRQVEWVAVSELTDPTPYLAGGELVLTTGVRWAEEMPDLRSYVRRLAERDIAGVGFGAAVVWERTPDELCAAAEEFGVTLVEVARETPFIAVGKEVSRLLAQEEYEGLGRAFTAQRALTRAALSGAGAVVDRLARELDGWVVLMEPDGAVRHAAPASAADHAYRLAPELPRLRGAGPRAGASVVSGREHVALQSLAAGRRVRGFLAVGAREGFGSHDRTLVHAAVSLLTLELERPAAEVGSGLVPGVVAALFDGALDPTSPGAAALARVLPAAPVVVAAAQDPPPEGPWPEGVWGTETTDVSTPGTARTLLLAAADRADLLPEVCDELFEGPVGLSEPVDYSELAVARAQAERALSVAVEEARAIVRSGDLPGGLLGMTDTPAGLRLADDLLGPLDRQRNAAELLASLRAYLAASGRWDAASESLGVHRHTLRYRMRRIRELLTVDLDDPDHRVELWIALRVREGRGRP
ncbi:PucR family transcriptional regulator [Nocardiopsis sp. MG754419]|uniref:PucR family transcriptional regulator n=1 Tax=Nocardiopsis sp. MG754419 TaxID=2259865 RepID=UPI001BA5CCBC|nr:PucR family transcriptional regulator [Nocardiopsis sp. MG754419]MBR8740733.1 PucR family transcriptional regulator [Nocardiopsis sp. MG754419]